MTTTIRPLFGALALSFLAACGSSPPGEASDPEPVTETEVSTTTTEVPAEAEATDDRYADAPEGTGTIASLLMAHHTEDLPDAETLHAHPEAEASLLWLADHGDRLVLRVRALAALRFFSGPDTRAAVLRFLGDGAAHPTLRAAAATGSGGLALDDELRGALENARASGDRRVELAVDARLARAAGAGSATTGE